MNMWNNFEMANKTINNQVTDSLFYCFMFVLHQINQKKQCQLQNFCSRLEMPVGTLCLASLRTQVLLRNEISDWVQSRVVIFSSTSNCWEFAHGIIMMVWKEATSVHSLCSLYWEWVKHTWYSAYNFCCNKAQFMK